MKSNNPQNYLSKSKILSLFVLFSLFIAQTNFVFSQTVGKFIENSATSQKKLLIQEITELERVVRNKIDNDVQTTARAFTDSENIFRSLKIFYPFKTLLDAINDGLGSVTSPIEDLLSGDLQFSVTATALFFAYENVVENSGKLALTFNKDRYIGSTIEMLENAKFNQPALGRGFDSVRYLNDITLWLNSDKGKDLIFIKHNKAKELCETIKPRGEQIQRLPPIRGTSELAKYISTLFVELRNEVEARSFSDMQVRALISVVKQAKTALLQSNDFEKTHSLIVPREIISSNCKPTNTQISLGKIIGKQRFLAEAFSAYDERARIELIMTVKTSADILNNYTKMRIMGGKNKVPKVLETYSQFSLAFDIGVKTIETITPQRIAPEDLIADLPQEMLLSLSPEFSQTISLIDTVASIIRLPKLPPNDKPQPPIEISKIPTLFLFDVSGSMSENGKINQAKEAGLDALREMREGGGGNSSAVAIMTFSGDSCGGNSTRKLLEFSGNLTEAERVMRGLPAPNGGTPLPQAKDAAWAETERFLGGNPNLREGRIVLLSDGQSTCGAIRPAGVFSRADITVSRNDSKIKFFTIGFDVPAGSVAERDLQYLASETGGKYFNAADRRQLIRAFQKQVRRFAPRPGNAANADFAGGLRAFADSDYALALESFQRYAAANPNDWRGIYNLALAFEANDRYKTAAETYRQYLNLAPDAPDRAKIEQRIARLNQDYADQFDYFINLIQSDADYLRRYYDSIFNRSSADLAQEFNGFVYEKGNFYKTLPEILEVNERWLINDAKDISSSINTLAKRARLESFDRDAVSLLTVPIAEIKDLLERLRNYQANYIR